MDKNRSRIDRRRSIRKQVIDEKFKLPFDLGWKRELVVRKSKSNRRGGDVYYYSPDNQRLRSLREIQAQLDLLNYETPLTIDCFTLINQPLGINDESKEIVRDANTKILKKDSGIKTVQHQKDPKPVPFNNENYKSSNETKIDTKNPQRSRYKKEKNNVEAMDTSPSTSQYIAEDSQTIQSTENSKVASSKTDNIEMHAPYKKIWHAKEHRIPISKPTKNCRENPVGPKLSEQISTLNIQLKINHVGSKKETSFSSSPQSKSLEMPIRNTNNEVYYEISSPDVMNEILLAVKTIIDEKHPAPLPTVLNEMSCSSWKSLPPSPILTITKDAKETLDVFTFEWNMHIDNSVADIKGYEIFYCCEYGQQSITEMWTKYCNVDPLPLPIAMKIHHLERGLKYYFSIRAIDVHSRVGPFCTPKIVYLE